MSLAEQFCAACGARVAAAEALPVPSPSRRLLLLLGATVVTTLVSCAWTAAQGDAIGATLSAVAMLFTAVAATLMRFGTAPTQPTLVMPVLVAADKITPAFEEVEPEPKPPAPAPEPPNEPIVPISRAGHELSGVLDYVQDLLEAYNGADTHLLMRKVSNLPYLLERNGIDVADYDGTNPRHFQFVKSLDPSNASFRTLRPALLSDGELRCRGLVAKPYEAMEGGAQ